jgi:hypothetical protein
MPMLCIITDRPPLSPRFFDWAALVQDEFKLALYCPTLKAAELSEELAKYHDPKQLCALTLPETLPGGDVVYLSNRIIPFNGNWNTWGLTPTALRRRFEDDGAAEDEPAPELSLASIGLMDDMADALEAAGAPLGTKLANAILCTGLCASLASSPPDSLFDESLGALRFLAKTIMHILSPTQTTLLQEIINKPPAPR